MLPSPRGLILFSLLFPSPLSLSLLFAVSLRFLFIESLFLQGMLSTSTPQTLWTATLQTVTGMLTFPPATLASIKLLPTFCSGTELLSQLTAQSTPTQWSTSGYRLHQMGNSSFFTSANSCEKISTECAIFLCFGEKDSHISVSYFLSFFLCLFVSFFFSFTVSFTFHMIMLILWMIYWYELKICHSTRNPCPGKIPPMTGDYSKAG